MKQYLAQDGMKQDSWSLYVEYDDRLANYMVAWGKGCSEQIRVTAVLPNDSPAVNLKEGLVPAILQIIAGKPVLRDIERPHFTMSPIGYELLLSKNDLQDATVRGMFTLRHAYMVDGGRQVGIDGLYFDEVLALEAARSKLQKPTANQRGILFAKRSENTGRLVLFDRNGNISSPLPVILKGLEIPLTGEITASVITDKMLSGLHVAVSDVMDLVF